MFPAALRKEFLNEFSLEFEWEQELVSELGGFCFFNYRILALQRLC